MITGAPTAVTATPAPADRAAAAAAFGAIQSVPAPFTGTGAPGSPAESATGWVALAASRRLSNPLPAAAVAETVTSGQLWGPTASSTAVNPIIRFLFNQTPIVSGIQTGQGPAGVVTGVISVTDPDSDTFSFTVDGDPRFGSVQIDPTGRYVYTPEFSAVRFGLTDAFTVTVSDAPSGFHIHGLCGLINLLTFGLLGNDGHSATQTVQVTVAPVNTAPTATFAINSPNPDTGVVLGAVVATDADGDPLNYTGAAATARGTLAVAADGSFSYTPTTEARHTAAALSATEADKTDTVIVTVTDGYGGVTPVSISVAIVPANAEPFGAVSVGSPDADTGVVRGAVVATDADGDILSYTGPAGTAKGSVTFGDDGGFAYTPTAAARHAAASLLSTAADQSDAFTVTVSDGHGGSLSLPVAVAISPANADPVGTVSVGDPNLATGLLVGAVLGSDADDDPLTFTGSTMTANGVVLVAPDGSFTYSPTAAARHAAAALTAGSAERTDTFVVTIADGYGGSAAVPVTVTISPANTAPIAVVGVGLPSPSTGVVTGNVVASDADGDPLSFSEEVTTSKGTAVVATDGSFSYAPTAAARHEAARLTATDADKADTFAITVSDGHGGSVAVPVTVTITPANAAPVATPVVGLPDPTTGVVAGAVLGADADGDTLSFSGSQSTAKGAVVVASDGGFAYTPTALARHLAAAPDATVVDTTDTFTVIVVDGYGGTVAVPVAVTVSPAAVGFAFVYGSGAEYWTPAARTALESAAATLSSYVVVDRPVTVTYDVSGTNNAGSGWLATAWVPFSSSGPGYYPSVAQRKIITGTDANGVVADGSISVNFGYPWAFGDTVPNNRFDLQAVALHELVHTLGFMTGFGNDPASIDRNWTTYDSFLAAADGSSPIGGTGGTYVWNSAYSPNLTGGNGGLYFAGLNAVSAYGGPVPIYTPGTWMPGSSLLHVDPAYAPSGTIYLMDPSDGYGPGVRVVTPVELGILSDLGYTIHAFFFVGFGVLRRRRRGLAQSPIRARHCSRSEAR